MFVYFRCKRVYENSIHPSNVNAVNDTRQQIRQLYSDRFVETNSSHVQNENNVNLVNSRHYGMDNNCPVCLNEPRFPIETNCGHLFCGKYSFINSL
jgi:RING finger protein 170